MSTEYKTVDSFWLPVRVLQELDKKRGKMSRNRFAMILIEKGLHQEDERTRGR
jgi:hypothetical protein